MSFLFQKVKNLALFILSLFSLFLLGRNSRLSKQNRRLNSNLQGLSQTIETQKKVINVIKTTKDTDIAGNIKRMQDNKL